MTTDYDFTTPTAEFGINCTGDVVVGDVIRWCEAVWGGSYRRPRRVGGRLIEAEVVRDSYGAEKQQHTFSLRVLRSEGKAPPSVGSAIRRKARNIYRNDTYRRPWDDESLRKQALDEKHTRGDRARSQRETRRQSELVFP